jgi:hypothetical protein
VLDTSLEIPADVLRGPQLFKALLAELPTPPDPQEPSAEPHSSDR